MSSKLITEQIFQEVRERFLQEEATSYNEYLDFIDQIIDENLNYGILTDEDDVSQLKADLELMWNALEEEIEY